MKIDDLDDENDRALAQLIADTLWETPRIGKTYNEMHEQLALTLLRTIKDDGWIPPEERDRAERKADALSQIANDAVAVAEERDEEIKKLRQQAYELTQELLKRPVTPPPFAPYTPGSGGYITPYTTPGISWTSSTTSANTIADEQIRQLYRGWS